MVLQTENERQKINSRWKYTGRNILSVMVAYEVNIFILSVKYWQTVSVCRDVGVCGIPINIFQLSIKYRQTISIYKDVGVCGISSKYFSTLCKIPTEKFCLEIRRWCFKKHI